MKIFLVGFMGCGKTTLGKKLASLLGYPFVDTDTLFEQNAGKSIPAFFAEFGEDKFRQTERNVLRNSPLPKDVVIATGGGAPCYSDNMEWMNRQGITVYLRLAPSVLASRLESATEVRPILQNYKGAALVEFIKGKLAEREPYYNQARFKVEGPGITTAKLAEVICASHGHLR